MFLVNYQVPLTRPFYRISHLTLNPFSSETLIASGDILVPGVFYFPTVRVLLYEFYNRILLHSSRLAFHCAVEFAENSTKMARAFVALVVIQPTAETDLVNPMTMRYINYARHNAIPTIKDVRCTFVKEHSAKVLILLHGESKPESLVLMSYMSRMLFFIPRRHSDCPDVSSASCANQKAT